MAHISTTPFGRRPVTAALVQRVARAHGTSSGLRADKWLLLNDLKTARKTYGLNDRALAVLSALLSFHPERDLDGDQPLIVWPSNAALSERANGIPESSLRRHLAALVEAGFLLRHDSPNGKRYARRAGGAQAAFGFSLRPLVQRAFELSDAADATRTATAELTAQRETISLILRDIGKYQDFLGATEPCPQLADLKRAFRRQLSAQALEELESAARALLDSVHKSLEIFAESQKMSGSAAENERHIQNSNKQYLESEPAENKTAPELTLQLVLDTCPDIQPYAGKSIETWDDLIQAAEVANPYMGIEPNVWREAQRHMGAPYAAATLAALLQRVSQIRSPGAYLRSLTARAVQKRFTPTPMLRALAAG